MHTDKRERALIFRQRLQEAMQKADVNKSELARRTHVDRSTIGQLLTVGHARLPNAQLTADIAQALSISTDWLLGLTERPEQPGDILDAWVGAAVAERSSADEQILDWHKEVAGYKIRHVPATLPDVLKTESMLHWEYAAFLGRSPEQAVWAMRERLEWMNDQSADYEIAVPIHEINALAAGTGYYEGLDQDIRFQQIHHMAEYANRFFPRLRLYFFDARQIFSAPVTIFGPRLAVIYVGKFYLSFREGRRVRTLSEHFDWLVREAEVDARDAANYLLDLNKKHST